MTCHGICLGQVLLRCQRKKRREERKSQREEGRRWKISCNMFLKGNFFFLLLSCLWSDYPRQCTVDQLHWKRIHLHTLCYLLRLFPPPPWERGKWKGRMHFKEFWSSPSGKRNMEGNSPVAFLISLTSPDWVMRLTGLLLVLRELTWMFFVCVCTVGMLCISDLLGAGAAVMTSRVP